jgi:ubiquitin-protein ligase
LAKGLLPMLHSWVTEAVHQRGPKVEVGGLWIGEFEESGGGLRFALRGLTGAGPGAVCMPESILFDHEYQARMLTAFRLQHPQTGNMGCFHRHPGAMSNCSSGDRTTDRAAVAASDTGALVFTIITLEPGRFNPRSIYHRNLRLDFYVMARRTGFEYVHVRPTLLRTPAIEASPALARLCLIRGPEVWDDLGALRRMRGIERVSIHLPADGAGTGVWVQARSRQRQEILRVFVREDGALVGRVGAGEATIDFPGPWEEPGIGRHVWLSHVFLKMLSELQEDGKLRYKMHCSSLLEDKKRLVAEVRAMQEKFGERAVLRHDKGQLFWEYTVEESGRSFPIEVRYPRHYPAKPPRVYSVRPLPHSPHQLVNNELCWIDQYSLRGDWNPARDTAAISVHAAHRWFACLLVYLTLGRWPEGADDQPGARATP